MNQNDFFCPECGTKLKQGEINRINSGIAIACHVCGIEISGKDPSEIVEDDVENQTESNDLGKKIKTGILSFVKKTKEWAEENFGDGKKPTNEYNQE